MGLEADTRETSTEMLIGEEGGPSPSMAYAAKLKVKMNRKKDTTNEATGHSIDQEQMNAAAVRLSSFAP